MARTPVLPEAIPSGPRRRSKGSLARGIEQTRGAFQARSRRRADRRKPGEPAGSAAPKRQGFRTVCGFFRHFLSVFPNPSYPACFRRHRTPAGGAKELVMDQEEAAPVRRRRMGAHGMMLRRKRIFARPREGLSYEEMATLRGTRPSLRQRKENQLNRS